MGRNIVIAPPAGQVSVAMVEGTPDKYAGQIVKLIPADVLGVYLAIKQLLETQIDPQNRAAGLVYAIILLAAFILITGITYFYLGRAGGITDTKQKIIATLSFFVWGLSIGGFYSIFTDSEATLKVISSAGGILIMVYTLVVPMIYGKTATQ